MTWTASVVATADLTAVVSLTVLSRITVVVHHTFVLAHAQLTGLIHLRQDLLWCHEQNRLGNLEFFKRTQK
jgi:hypothetical protein